MRTMFENLAKYALLRAGVYTLLGLLMLLFPEAVLNVIVYVIAGYLVVMGLVGIVQYLRTHNQQAGAGLDFVMGILMVVLGIVMFIFTRQIISILPIFLGILLAVGGAFLLVQAVNAKQFTGKLNVLLLVLGIVLVVVGVVVLFNPFGSAVLLMRVYGVALLVMAVGELVTYFHLHNAGKTL